MTESDIRNGFNQMIEAALAEGNSDAAARMEVAREYFTNPNFKSALEQHVWQINMARA